MQHVYIVATVDGSVGALVGLDAQILISCTCVYSVHDSACVRACMLNMEVMMPPFMK